MAQNDNQPYDQAWCHAACLTIAETGQKWGNSVHPSLAMKAVYRLRQERDELLKLAKTVADLPLSSDINPPVRVGADLYEELWGLKKLAASTIAAINVQSTEFAKQIIRQDLAEPMEYRTPRSAPKLTDVIVE